MRNKYHIIRKSDHVDDGAQQREFTILDLYEWYILKLVILFFSSISYGTQLDLFHLHYNLTRLTLIFQSNSFESYYALLSSNESW